MVAEKLQEPGAGDSSSLMIVSVTFLVKHLTWKRVKYWFGSFWVPLVAGVPAPAVRCPVTDLQLLQSPLQNWVSGDQAVTSRHRWSAALHLGPSCQLGSASVLSLFINTPPAPLFTAHYLSVFMFYEWQRRDTAVIMQHHAAPCSTMQ